MKEPSLDLRTLAIRIEKAEKQNRKIMLMGLLVGLFLVIVVIFSDMRISTCYSSSQPPKIIEAEEIRVIENGKPCVRIIGSTIWLFNKYGESRLMIGVGSDSGDPAIFFYGKYSQTPSIDMKVIGTHPSIELVENNKTIWEKP
jgi:hypothetical protein